MSKRVRVDAELVRRGLARSREEASALIRQRKVTVNGLVVAKPASQIEVGAPLIIHDDPDVIKWASRGAYKLLGALEAFAPEGLTVQGCRCLDAGSSTGGFTDVLLHEGAKEVIAVDVGYGQLIWRLQSDKRVVVFDRTNARGINAAVIGGPVDLVVSDLSFISLKLVLKALVLCCRPGADLMLMVKPQFEVGKSRVGAGGVVRDPSLRIEAVLGVARHALELGVTVRDVVASPLPGPSGNVEYFLWLCVPEPETVPVTVTSEAPGAAPDTVPDTVPNTAPDIAREAALKSVADVMQGARLANSLGVSATPNDGNLDILEAMVTRAVKEGPQ